MCLRQSSFDGSWLIFGKSTPKDFALGVISVGLWPGFSGIKTTFHSISGTSILN
jgi:hypothetical protein